jgi:hypothetical protein
MINAAQPMIKYNACPTRFAFHEILSPMPTAAAAQIASKKGTPTVRGKANRHTGVYEPAMST